MSVSFPRPIAKAPFSFHCTICYDAFHLTDRPPVVLPCGHTYLCKPCSERLDRCMECRTPLMVKVKVGTRDSSITSLSSSRARVADRHGRYNQGQSPISPYFSRPSDPNPSSEKGRVPIAKNHVLMCLMKAAMQDGIAGAVDDAEYDSGNEDEIVVRGIRVLSATSGTYKVREKKGLPVYSISPKGISTKVQSSSGGYLRTLKYGQTVQISRFNDNFALVAHGVGFILADMSSQLVKVGELQDEPSQFEATSVAMEDEISALEKRIEKLRRSHHSIKEKARIAQIASRPDDVFGPEPIEQPVQTVGYEQKCDDTKQDLAPSHATIAISKPFIKQPKSPRSFLGLHSLEEQIATWLPCMSDIEPSRSFEDMATFLGLHAENNQGTETIFSKYFASIWNEEKEDFSETRSVTSWLSGPSSSSSTRTEDHVIWKYASGYSGHSGLNSTRYGNRRRMRRVRMMSHY